MKKIILFLFVLYTGFNVKAVSLQIVGASFDESAEISRGTQQWIDVKVTGGTWTSSTRLRLFINHINNVGVASNMQELLNEQFSTYFLNIPLNLDGESRRVYFNMPINYDDGKFSIDVNLNPTTTYGVLESIVTGINDPNYIENITVYYFSLAGIAIENPIQGFYIRICGTKRSLIYIE
jgi:hypothetical protein